MRTVYYDHFIYNNEHFNYAYTDQGICFIGSPNKKITEINNFINFDELLERSNSLIKEQILNYLNGKTTNFELSIDLSWSTDFQKSVYKELQKVTYGHVTDYSSLAQAMKHPTAVRAIATAIAKNPILFIIPCHRVIRKDGTLGGYRAGLPLKKQLLELEKR